MNWPYLHIVVNHFPIVLPIAALVAALLGLLRPRRGLWLYTMGTLTVAAILAYPVHWTGDQADHALADPWYIRPGAIDAHDNAAGNATAVIIVAGILAAYGWWRTLRRPAEPIPLWLRLSVVAGALAGSGTVGYAALLGGRIVHEAPVLGLPQSPTNLPAGIVAPAPEGKAIAPQRPQ